MIGWIVFIFNLLKILIDIIVMYKAKPKRKLKIVEKPKETPKTKIKISKEQKAKNDKTRKKILEKPKPKPKKKLKIVEKKEPRTIGSDLTGLNKKEMNVMSMLDLFGRLPVELKQNIDSFVDPTGYNKIDEALDSSTENYASYLFSGGGDYTEVGLTQAQNRFYQMALRKGYGNLTDKQQDKFENLEQKILEKTNSSVREEYTDQFEVFKKSNKNKAFSTEEAIEEAYLAHMDNYYNSPY